MQRSFIAEQQLLHLVVDQHAVELQPRMGVLAVGAGPTQSSRYWVRQQAEAGSLVIESLTLTLKDQIQQSVRLFLLTAPALQQQQGQLLQTLGTGPRFTF